MKEYMARDYTPTAEESATARASCEHDPDIMPSRKGEAAKYSFRCRKCGERYAKFPTELNDVEARVVHEALHG